MFRRKRHPNRMSQLTVFLFGVYLGMHRVSGEVTEGTRKGL